MTNASHYKISTLRYIRDYHVNEDHLRQMHQGTCYSILRAAAKVTSTGRVVLTQEGGSLLAEYDATEMNRRRKVADLTDRVASLLRLVRTRNKRSPKA